LAASSGAGGIQSFTITNWIRDKGFGMGAHVGAIPSMFRSRTIVLSRSGKIFHPNAESLAHWRNWWRYVYVDQVFLWGVGALLGMYLNVNLSSQIVPTGEHLEGLAAGAYQAQHLASIGWAGLWTLTLLNGFWILFSTQLGNTDALVRTVTDILWMSSPRVRNWKGGKVHWIYYGVLSAYIVWAVIAVGMAPPMTLFKIMANIGGLMLVIGGIQIIIVNRKFIPSELRAPIWREMMVAGCVVFYGYFLFRML
jgi:hypothetical protein